MHGDIPIELLFVVAGKRADVFYSAKGYSSISLNRRSSTTGPTGVYECSLPDSGETAAKTLRIGIYASEADGESCTISLNALSSVDLQPLQSLETESTNLEKPLRLDVPLNFQCSPSSG